jgi:hypothetical protein
MAWDINADANSGWYNTTDIAALSITPTTCTVAAWIRKPADWTATSVYLSLYEASTGHYIRIGGISSEKIRAQVSDGGAARTINSTNTVTTDTWTSVIYMIRSATDRELWIDGTSEGTSTVSCSPGTPDVLGLGLLNSSASPTLNSPYDGQLGQIAVWNAAISDESRAAIDAGFSAELVQPDSLILHFDMIGTATPRSVRGGVGLTAAGTGAGNTVFAHHRIVQRHPETSIFVPAAAAAPALSFLPLLGVG